MFGSSETGMSKETGRTGSSVLYDCSFRYTPVKMNGTVINDNYCDQLTMRFSFWMIISYYIIGGVLCWCGCLAVSLVSCLFADG